MNVQRITYKWLNALPVGYEFTGRAMRNSINKLNDLDKETATYLRMQRYYRKDTGNTKCINRMKSLYKKIKKT